MKSEQDIIKALSTAAETEDLKMPPSKQQAIWNAIEMELDRERPELMRRRNRNSLFGTSVAIVAALVIVAGGIYALHRRELYSGNKISSSTTATQKMTNPLISQLPNAKYNLIPTLQKVGFHYTLPSWLPYTPTMVDSSGRSATPNSAKYSLFMVDFFSSIQSSKQEDVNLQEGLSSTNPLTASQGTHVTLDNGATAYFNSKGPNGATLDWYVNGIEYSLSAAQIDIKTRSSTPDLDEATLLKIANSFR